MSRPTKDSGSTRSSASIPLTVGSAFGAVMGLLASQVESKPYRDVLSAFVPVAAVMVSALTAFVSEIVRQRWNDAEHDRAAKIATAAAQAFINDEKAPLEVREHAQQVLVKASIAQLDYHVDTLNRASRPPSDPSRRSPPRLQSPKNQE